MATPVMNKIIVTDNGSASRPISTSKSPATTQSKIFTSTMRSSPSRLTMPKKTATEARNDPAMAAVATHPASGSPSRRPKSIKKVKPTSGNSGTSHTSSTAVMCLSPQQREVVGCGLGTPAHDGHDDGEANHHFGGGNYKHE